MSKSRALRSSWELRYLLADFDPFFLRTPWKEPSGSNSHHFHNLQNNWRNQLNVILPVVGREKEEEERRKEQNLKEKKAVECYLQTASKQTVGHELARTHSARSLCHIYAAATDSRCFCRCCGSWRRATKRSAENKRPGSERTALLLEIRLIPKP